MFADTSESFVAIIDEPENHLHPELQRNFLGNLIKAFPNVQLCAQPRVCSLTGGNPVYPRPNQPDISESWDGISNGI